MKRQAGSVRIIFGVESSCDDTAAAVLRCNARPGSAPEVEVLSSRVFSQDDAHAPYGGVVPEIAARAHADRIDYVATAAFEEAGITPQDLDLIAATAGPGLIGGVMAGLTFAKGLRLAAGVPLIPVNHLEGHALSVGLEQPLDEPYLLLLVSGGHTQLLRVEGPGRASRVGSTIDDAAGEAFDKTAKLMGLGVPGGPAIERAAERGPDHGRHCHAHCHVADHTGRVVAVVEIADDGARQSNCCCAGRLENPADQQDFYRVGEDAKNSRQNEDR